MLSRMVGKIEVVMVEKEMEGLEKEGKFWIEGRKGV